MAEAQNRKLEMTDLSAIPPDSRQYRYLILVSPLPLRICSYVPHLIKTQQQIKPIQKVERAKRNLPHLKTPGSYVSSMESICSVENSKENDKLMLMMRKAG